MAQVLSNQQRKSFHENIMQRVVVFKEIASLRASHGHLSVRVLFRQIVFMKISKIWRNLH